jgi:DNA/RNA endonuclease YhcR with UshA esterase domain
MIVASSRCSFLKSVVVAFVVSGWERGTTRTLPPILDIETARTLQHGSIVSVQGTCTVPSGIFKSSTFDQGFAIQDNSGGIYVPTQYNYELQLNEGVGVTGVLGRSKEGLTILTPRRRRDVRRLGRKLRPPVVTQKMDTGNINENSEGLLVTISGSVTTPVTVDLPYGYKFDVNDDSGGVQVYVSASCDLDLSQMTMGKHVSITGFSGQYDTVYEVQPRNQDDLIIY